MPSRLKAENVNTSSNESGSALLVNSNIQNASQGESVSFSSRVEPETPKEVEKLHEHHEGCLESMRIGAQMSTEALAPMSPEESFSNMLSNPKSEALYEEFEETVTLPNGVTARRSELSLQFEGLLNDLPDNDVSPSGEI